MKTILSYLFTLLLLATFVACSSNSVRETATLQSQSIMSVPVKLATLDETKLSATLNVYDDAAKLITAKDLTIANGQVSSESFELTKNQTYVFVIVFYYTLNSEQIPVAYVLLSQELTGNSLQIAFDSADIVTDPASASADTSLDITSYGIPNLDSDGDGVGNLAEIGSGEICEQDYPLYRDADGDGYGASSQVVYNCTATKEGYVANGTDCDDASSAIHPGATEICDGIDNDCGGTIDEDGLTRYYYDGDDDGYGVTGEYVDACALNGNYTTAERGDCNDANSAIYPNAFEGCSDDGIDNDCDSVYVEGFLCKDYIYDDPLGEDDVVGWSKIIRGDSASDNLGEWVSSAGDVTGDGVPDIMISDDGDDPNGTNSGSVYFFSGYSEFDFTEALNDGNYTRFQGTVAGDFLGRGISAVGDLDKDGNDEILLGAESYDYGENSTGSSFVYYGESGWGDIINISTEGYGLAFFGESANDCSTVFPHASGDVNGDGELDLIISGNSRDDYGYTNNGVAYLYYGPFNFGDDIDLSTASATREKFYGPLEDQASFSLRSYSIAGDVNADGNDDIVIAAYYEDAGGQEQAGAIYLYYGGPITDDHETTDANVRIVGEQEDSYTGFSLTSDCDVNDDGYDDILIGAPRYDHDSQAEAGAAYLFFGPVGTSTELIELNIISADVKFTGEEAGDNAGVSVACDYDVNGDGYDDLLIGAHMNSNDGVGRVYLIHGRDEISFDSIMSLSQADISFTGNEPDGYFGYSVAYAGDVNQDGHEEILIGSNAEDNDSFLNAGAVYLITLEE